MPLEADRDPSQETCPSSEPHRCYAVRTLTRCASSRNPWLGTGNPLSLPAEAVPFVDIGSLHRKIKGREREVEKLTAQLPVLAGKT